MKYKWNDLKKCNDYKSLDEYLSQSYKSRIYCHYTNLSSIDDIIGTKEFWISTPQGFNDNQDREQFKDNKCYYSICFSSGVHENLSLWYMYAGVDGRGGRLEFNHKQLNRIIENGRYILYEFKNGQKKQEIMELQNNVSMKRILRDVIYYNKKKNSKHNRTIVELKYNNCFHTSFPLQEFEKYKTKHIGFLKDIVWFYEKETRIVVELIGEAADYINKEENKGKEYKVVWQFCNENDEIHKIMKIAFAPEITKYEINRIMNDKKNIMDFILNSSKAKLSQYSGKIEMNLCKNCDFKKKTYIRNSEGYQK